MALLRACLVIAGSNAFCDPWSSARYLREKRVTVATLRRPTWLNLPEDLDALGCSSRRANRPKWTRRFS